MFNETLFTDILMLNRVLHHLQFKRDYIEGLNDLLDLVPIGALYGNRRKAKRYNPFLMACYDPDTEEYQSVCRVMTVFSVALNKEVAKFFEKMQPMVAETSPVFVLIGEKHIILN
ncbi:DNA ligase 6 isoform X1 [Tanacetum coccineum]